MDVVRAVPGAQAEHQGAVFELHRIKMIDNLQKAGLLLLEGLFDFAFDAFNDLPGPHFAGHGGVEPIHTGDVRHIIEPEAGVIAQETGDLQCGLLVDQE